MEEESFVPKGLLPAYLAEVFGQLYDEDGLVVLGKGLQSDMLLASLVRFYADREEGHYVEEKKAGKPPLVLVLGLHSESERTTLLEILASWGTPPEIHPTILTNEAGQSKERALIYQQGGVFVITSRILIVDLLTATIDVMQIDGLLVAHAERVTETSTEAFIIRIIQSQRQFGGSSNNCAAFVKAISESPEQVMSGFSKVDKILKALHVQRLYLYPRFHDLIREELEGRNPPKVVEFHQDLSALQKEMQQAIAVALQTVIRKLKESKALVNLTLLLEGEQFTVENLVTNPLDRALSRNLDHDWHRLSPETKQLIQDLRTLRTLFQSLLTYDCVSFYKLLQSIQSMSAASKYPSMWLLTPAADVLFRKAKERLFVLHRAVPTKQIPDPILKCRPVLEENPKWHLLRRILSAIRETFAGEQLSGNTTTGCTNVLIFVKDDRTMATVKDYLVQGKRALLFKWLRFLEQQNDRSRSITVHNGGVETLSEESRVLLEEESRCRRILFGDHFKRKSRRNLPINHIPEHVRKRRRITREKARGESNQQTEDLERNAALDEAVELMENDLNDGSVEDAPINSYDDRLAVSFPDELRVVLKSYASSDQASLLLQDVSPRYVLFYDTDISFVRAVEIHAALSDIPVEVHFLMFTASAEDKIFMKTLEKEQNIFERLINHKKMMSPPALQCGTTTQEIQFALTQGSLGGSYMGGTLPLAVDTRKGRKANEAKRDIAVDVREFRSVLPSILHQGGMRLAPVTLIVGDFVLSSVHCIERKSISDLFGSFASGRLYTQVEAMVKYYKVPCLMIEFDPAKSFSLQNAREIGVDIRTDSACSKICLLTMHFPQLRILWSKSPHDTLKIFKDLKRNHDEVDVERAMEIGRNELEDSLFETSSESDELNEVARDVLLRLPGVNIHSARKIMQNCDCLAELCDMSRDELRKIAGPVTGQKLFTFFRQNISAATRNV